MNRILFVLVLLFVILSSQISVANQVFLRGWTEVGDKWPSEGEEYFVATGRSHHFIEVRELPKNPKQDLLLTLEYHYGFSSVKPIIQMTSCNSNIYLLAEDSENESNKWLQFKRRIDSQDCNKRNELTFNIVLHDKGDVFAWRLMSIEPAPPISTPPKPSQLEPPGPEKEPESAGENLDEEEEGLASMIDQDSDLPELVSDKEGKQKNPIPPNNGKAGEEDKTGPQPKPNKVPKSPEPEKEPGSERAEEEATAELKPQPNEEQEKPKPEKEPESGKAETEPKTGPQPKPSEKEDKKAAENLSKEQEDLESMIDQDSNLPESVSDNEGKAKNLIPPNNARPTTDNSSKSSRSSPNERPSESSHKTSGDPKTPAEASSKQDPKKTDPSVKPQFKQRLQRPSSASDLIISPREQESKMNRRTRSLGSLNEFPFVAPKSQPTFEKLTCKPSSCDRSVFVMTDFLPMVGGLPRDSQSKISTEKKYFLSINEGNLTITFDLNDLDDVDERKPSSEPKEDICFNWELYMDEGTIIELMLEEKGSELDKGKKSDNLILLESVQRKSGESTAGKWEKFSRCMSDYMPKYERRRAHKSPTKGFVHYEDEYLEDNQINLIVRSTGVGPNRLVSIVVDRKKAFQSSQLHPVQRYLPDIKHLENTKRLNELWIIDRDGLSKARADLKCLQESPPSSSGPSSSLPSSSSFAVNLPRRHTMLMEVNRIDPMQEYFDLTSRWLQIKDIELIDSKIMFRYRFRHADWIDQVALQFQRAGDPLDKWVSKTAYEAERGKKAGTGLESSIEDIPIRVTGLDCDHFRIRVRHKVKKGQQGALKLEVESLSLADYCSFGEKDGIRECQNGGQCTSTGPTTFSCDCIKGYSDTYCEKKEPCDVEYLNSTLTGQELCAKVNATCVRNIPVFRCQWPNDEHFRCEVNSTITSEASSANGFLSDAEKVKHLEEEVTHLKEEVSTKWRLPIILGAFLVAVSIFSVILIVGMISRLNKTKNRLKESWNDSHEMAKRYASSTSTVTEPKRVIRRAAYNNGSFDVE